MDFICGILTGLVAWVVTTHLLVPRVQFSQDIGRTFPRGKVPRYRVKIRNIGLRSIIDIQVVCRLRIKGLDTEPEKTQVIYIRMGYERTPMLAKGKALLYHLIINDLDPYALSILPGDLREKHRVGALTLDDLLALDAGADMRVYLYGYDGFSGARKLYASQPYGCADVKTGIFRKGDMAVTPAESDAEDAAPQAS
jgi:hypothetical protein